MQVLKLSLNRGSCLLRPAGEWPLEGSRRRSSGNQSQAWVTGGGGGYGPTSCLAKTEDALG